MIANASLPSIVRDLAVDAVRRIKLLGNRRNDLIHSFATHADPEHGPMQRIIWDVSGKGFARRDFGYAEFDAFTGDVYAAVDRSVGYILLAVNQDVAN